MGKSESNPTKNLYIAFWNIKDSKTRDEMDNFCLPTGLFKYLSEDTMTTLDFSKKAFQENNVKEDKFFQNEYMKKEILETIFLEEEIMFAVINLDFFNQFMDIIEDLINDEEIEWPFDLNVNYQDEKTTQFDFELCVLESVDYISKQYNLKKMIPQPDPEFLKKENLTNSLNLN